MTDHYTDGTMCYQHKDFPYVYIPNDDEGFSSTIEICYLCDVLDQIMDNPIDQILPLIPDQHQKRFLEEVSKKSAMILTKYYRSRYHNYNDIIGEFKEHSVKYVDIK